MLKFVVALYVFVYSFIAYSIHPITPVNKGLIVSFSASMDEVVLNEITMFRFSKIGTLNSDKTIFKFNYRPSFLSENEALNLINKLPNVNFIQEDSRVYLRNTTPNDALFINQWYMNMIKATSAWDSIKGGVNLAGDTIVIAVVDDGLHVNHPDFNGNIWINYADTANNGIDDDNNGFIDDHYGWNFMGQNNDISDSTNYAARHGSNVAGIIGAKGNDVTGICGIMWNVKLMFSNIADTSSTAGSNFPFQSDVIRAYDYVLQQRKLYNQSNGSKGAFVVAINSSWGIDGKFANQAPIWCAMYDSLGKAGILTAGATSNGPINVENAGDLPSLCTSKHLIVVSAVNSSDVYSNRGYGTTSVDISAPGEGIYTTYSYTKFNQQSGLYGTFSGTSAATPMVTGAIGLLNAYACQKLIDLIKSNPENANLLIRRFILEGVDTLPALVGRNATTGRLNIAKAMKIMDSYCDGTLHLKKMPVLQQIVLYPNPGNGELFIQSNETVLKVECYNTTGQMMDCEINENKINITGLAYGVYMFRILTSQGVATLPYIKNE